MKDEQGSTVFLLDREHETQSYYAYDSFGNMRDRQGSIGNRILYTGQQYDGMAEQYYLRARYYNPVIGRFIQEDPYRGDGLNLYAYCANNPVRYFDPSGYIKIPTDVKCQIPGYEDPDKIRQEYVQQIEQILKDKIGVIYELDPNALVGFRGSLITGEKYESGLPFDPDDFDVDAFIVSNMLSDRYFDPENNWKNSRDIPGMSRMWNEAEQNFINNFPGYRLEPGKPFTFRVYDQNEYVSKIVPGGVKIINEEE